MILKLDISERDVKSFFIGDDFIEISFNAVNYLNVDKLRYSIDNDGDFYNVVIINDRDQELNCVELNILNMNYTIIIDLEV